MVMFEQAEATLFSPRRCLLLALTCYQREKKCFKNILRSLKTPNEK
jgi:hypothetical protein